MASVSDHDVTTLRAAAHRLHGAAGDYDPLLDLVGDARFVLLGEATHGSAEFYDERASITRRLIDEKDFTAVAVEADWPDARRVDRYVRGEGHDPHALAALSGFERFPAWMWRNSSVLGFIEWLRRRNEANPDAKAGFYGLDLYSLFTSIQEVLRYLERVDPAGARQARRRYACFDHAGPASQQVGLAAAAGKSEFCRQAVAATLHQLEQRRPDYVPAADTAAEDAFFDALQNAQLVKNAEEYYRTMARGRILSWNVRDSHMADTLDALARHLSRAGRPAKIVVWAHNSHIGDARATEIGRQGEWNLGQLARTSWDGDACLVGFTTYEGRVTAASEWDGPALHKQVRPGMTGSYEQLLHSVGLERFLLLLREPGAAREVLMHERLERAIGVLYLPRSERRSHYFMAQLPCQFDALIHIDRTAAVMPLDATSGWHGDEPPETYPDGL
ncbi:erythromycin esterase family protein [Massilia sp. H6]|uniref:erythromycin esterase family protein n=1 Tax=Massilia sp. H6 TaxID=2970464 RepID=UPI0021682775|nr:erythromycin esterase family protein [Massilia sp. H6]UVW27375.1 erythromycin esterase family protein [Massilia sp. H6]